MRIGFFKKSSYVLLTACFLVHPLSLLFSTQVLLEEKTALAEEAPTHTINFHEVSVIEFIRYVSRVAHVNFIFDDRDLQFNVSFSSGKSIYPEQILKALIHMLRAHGLSIFDEGSYLVIHSEREGGSGKLSEGRKSNVVKADEAMTGKERPSRASLGMNLQEPDFLVYKLQYHPGNELEEAIKRIAGDLDMSSEASAEYVKALHSVQWVKMTNSLVASGNPTVLASVRKLIESLDVPLRQVFIEVLVIETDVKKSVDFGLQWAAGGQYKKSLGMGMGNFAPTPGGSPFALTFQGINPANPPAGASQFPLGRGFDMGVIGDIIMHKGQSFLSLGSLVSALQMDGDSSIVLNQKIITQDNKNSTIFVGDNIPFTGSIVQTVGSSQQTTANIEYRDIGVTLSITPRLGEGDVITLDLNEEISEIIPTLHSAVSANQVNGLQTTKTNMMTHVHVPDKHFLVLSGMIRNARTRQKSGIPCLGGLPGIGALFSKTQKQDEKRNIIIFVRPRIIHSVDEYRTLTDVQAELQNAEGYIQDGES